MIKIWVWLIKYTMFHVLLGLIKWLIRHKTPRKLFWHTAKKYKMGNIFINLETLGDLRQIFLPSLILNVFFLLLNSPKILFLNSFHIFYYKFCEIFFIRNSARKTGKREPLRSRTYCTTTTVCGDLWNTKTMLKLSVEG